MSTTPEEYFGPHAKRWTSPTGQVFSLRPSDYERMVNTQMELDFNARLLEEMEQELTPAPDAPGITATEEDWKAVTNGEGTVYDESWPRVISIDTAYDNIDPETAAIFKERGALIVPENPTSEQVFHDVDPDFAERISGGTLHHASLVKVQEFGHIDGADPMPDRIPVNEEMMQVLASGKPFHFTLNDDGSIAQIHPFQEEAGEPAARHLKHRKPLRAAAAALLVYVIIVIGVTAVAGVMP